MAYQTSLRCGEPIEVDERLCLQHGDDAVAPRFGHEIPPDPRRAGVRIWLRRACQPSTRPARAGRRLEPEHGSNPDGRADQASTYDRAQLDVSEDTRMKTSKTKLLRLSAAVSAAAALALVAVPMTSQAATTASVTLTGGSLAFINSTPAGTVTFPATTLNGTNQTVTAPLAFDVGDATGSGAGWNVTATSTTFTSGAHTLPTTATTVQAAPTAACDTGATGCTTATTGVTYPYTLPAAATAPTATKLFNATANTGMGNQTFTPTWSLAIPANAVASGTPYTSTWTFSLVSGP